MSVDCVKDIIAPLTILHLAWNVFCPGLECVYTIIECLRILTLQCKTEHVLAEGNHFPLSFRKIIVGKTMTCDP